MWSLGRFAAATALALLALRSAAGLRRSWLRREIRQALGILQRLQERAGQCAATEGREGRRAAKRALAIAGAARELEALLAKATAELEQTKGAAESAPELTAEAAPADAAGAEGAAEAARRALTRRATARFPSSLPRP